MKALVYTLLLILIVLGIYYYYETQKKADELAAKKQQEEEQIKADQKLQEEEQAEADQKQKEDQDIAAQKLQDEQTKAALRLQKAADELARREQIVAELKNYVDSLNILKSSITEGGTPVVTVHINDVATKDGGMLLIPSGLSITYKGIDGDYLLFEYDDDNFSVSLKRHEQGLSIATRKDKKPLFDGVTEADLIHPNGEVPVGSEDLVIIKATYGTHSVERDITNLIKSKVNNGRLNISVNPAEIGGDPVAGQVKTFYIKYIYQGMIVEKSYKDFDQVSEPTLPTTNVVISPPVISRQFMPPSPLPAQTNWTWITSDGQTFNNVIVTKVEADCVTILHHDGGARIEIAKLPADIQQKLNYDPLLAAEATAKRSVEDQVSKTAMEQEKQNKIQEQVEYANQADQGRAAINVATKEADALGRVDQARQQLLWYKADLQAAERSSNGEIGSNNKSIRISKDEAGIKACQAIIDSGGY